MSVRVNVQYAVEGTDALPDVESFRLWARAALNSHQSEELVIRLVDSEESATLNKTYRNKSGPTNVLSFPFEPPAQIETSYIGDVVICAPLVAQEARQQGKQETNHWAHLVVHGILHLQGYDHNSPGEALAMEGLESDILTRLGYPDPYLESKS